MRVILILLMAAAALKAQTVVRVNVGGGEYTDSSSNVWAADTFCTGTAFSTGTAISGTSDQTLYQTGRSDYVFGCTFSVPIGYYNITLKMARGAADVPGKRIFNVFANNVKVLPNLDIGDRCTVNTACDFGATAVPVPTGTLTLSFAQVSGAPLVNAISVDLIMGTVDGVNIALRGASYTEGQFAQFAADGSLISADPPGTPGGSTGDVQCNASGSFGACTTVGTGDVVKASAASTTVNGQTCALGSTCTVTDSTKVPTTTTVNGHALSGNVTVAPADLAAGALANGMTATTQGASDNSTKLATTAYVDSAVAAGGGGGGASAFQDLTDCKVTLAGAVATIPSACGVKADTSSQITTAGASATATWTSGDGTSWLGYDGGVYKVWYNHTVTCGAGLTCVGSTATPPYGAVLLAHVNTVSGVHTLVDDRGAFIQRKITVAGAGVSDVVSSGNRTITITATPDACVGTPGDTTGSYRSLCADSAGAAYVCNNASGCTVAADWVAQGGGGGGGTVTFTTPGSSTWTVPAGVTRIHVRAMSGGQAGARGYYGAGTGGAGGGFVDTWCDVTAGASLAYAVGAGGVGTNASSTKDPGGNTTVDTAGACVNLKGGDDSDGTGTKGVGRDLKAPIAALWGVSAGNTVIPKQLYTMLLASNNDIIPISSGVGAGWSNAVASGNNGAAGLSAYMGGAGGGGGARNDAAGTQTGGAGGTSVYGTGGAGGGITASNGAAGSNCTGYGSGGGGGAWDGTHTTSGGNGCPGFIRIDY